MSDVEVPGPDAFEQALAVEEDDAGAVAPPSFDAEIPEADALEQARVEPLSEDDELR